MIVSRVSWIVLSMVLAGMLLTACQEIDPLNPLDSVPTRVALRDMPNADVEGIVRDSNGAALADARIVVGASEGARAAVTAVDGSYRLSDLEAGTYMIVASRTGYLPGRTRIVLEGTEVSDANIVLEPYRVAAGHRVDVVEVAAAGALVQPWILRSERVQEVPDVELRLTKGTVLRESSGRIATDPVELGVTPISGRALVPPAPGTFGITESSRTVVPGEPMTIKVDVDLGEGRVAEDVEIVEANPLLGKGARASLVQPMAAFALEPEGLLLENPDGTPRPQQVVLGNLPFEGRLAPGSIVDLVDAEGNVVEGIVGADSRSVEGKVARLTRYDLLVQMDVEVQETTVRMGGAAKPVAIADVVVVYQEDGTTFTFPELDENDPEDVALAEMMVAAVGPELGPGCEPSNWIPGTTASTRIHITITVGGVPYLVTYAIVDRYVCNRRFIVEHEQGQGG